MNERSSLYRKMAYLLVICVFLVPIARLGLPSTRDEEGGRLARLRSEYDLGQSDLGEIDPASETIRLATLGLRGVATSLLWNQAIEYKKKEDWTNFEATLKQLAHLQPYFISFWRYQAWNLTYNVSVELDDVRDRYYYVRRGIEFLKEGIKHNRNSPYLLAELGWFIGNKIGRADEWRHYRRLFKADDDFHPEDRPPERRDNWLVSRDWYQAAVDVVDSGKKSMGNKNPTTFYADPAKSQMSYSEAIEKEGTFGEKARLAWKAADQMWKDYGNRQLKSTHGYMIRLGSMEEQQEVVDELEAELLALSPGVREEILKERRAALTDAERSVYDKPFQELTEEERELASEVAAKLKIEDSDIADYISQKDPKLLAKARKLGSRLLLEKGKLRLIRINRDVSNFVYWRERASFEQDEQTLRAHELAFAARRAFQDDADLLGAKRLFEESFQLWAQAIKDHPLLDLDSPTGADITEDVGVYAKVLDQLDKSLLDPDIADAFPLWDVVEMNDTDRDFADALAAWRARHEEDAQPDEEEPSDGEASPESSDGQSVPAEESVEQAPSEDA